MKSSGSDADGYLQVRYDLEEQEQRHADEYGCIHTNEEIAARITVFEASTQREHDIYAGSTTSNESS